MKTIFILFIFLFVSACGGGGSDAIEEKVTEMAAQEATNTTNPLAADAFAKAEAEKLIRFGTGKFGQSTFQ